MPCKRSQDLSKILPNAFNIIGGNLFIISTQGGYPSKTHEKRVVGVAGLMILVMFSPTGSLQMILSNLFLYLISILPLHAPICRLKPVILLPPSKGSPKILQGPYRDLELNETHNPDF